MDVCRICRGEETEEEPLFHPCRCSGSIKYVHQDCLLEWLGHARGRSHCELCGTEYRLRERYRKDTPSVLSIRDYVAYARDTLIDNLSTMYYIIRGVVLASLLGICMKYLVEYGTIMAVLPASPQIFSKALETLTSRMKQKPPRHSSAPLFDWILSWVFKPSEFWSAWVDGLLLITAILALFLFTSITSLWVLEDQAVIHDLDHIAHGEISHMDNGDDDSIADIGEEVDEDDGVRVNLRENLRENFVDEEVQNVADNGPEADVNAQRGVEREDESGENGVEHYDGEPNDAGPNDVEINLPVPPRRPNVGLEIIEEAERQRLNPFMDLDEADVLEEAAQDAGNEDNFNFVLRGFGGPNREILAEFAAITLFVVEVILFLYILPYALGRLSSRSVLIALAHATDHIGSRWLTANIVALSRMAPSSLTGHVALLLSYWAILIMTQRALILTFMGRLLKSNTGIRFVAVAYQFYAVVKTVSMIMVEFLVFPEFCGTLLHLVLIPITPTWAWHWRLFQEHRFSTVAGQWLAGFLYMHALLIFVNSCRKTLRKGVLFFVHDSDAPDFLRSIVILSLVKQIRRICISALLYASFIVGGVGSVTASLPLISFFKPLNLVYWPGVDTLRLWPAVIALGALFAPLSHNSKALYNVLVLWTGERVWLRIFDTASRKLDLESWLFARRRALSDEEASHLEKNDLSRGYFVRAPATNKFRSRRNLRLFVPVDQDDRPLIDDNKQERDADGTIHAVTELEEYVVVWRPAFFWTRMMALIFFVWLMATCLALMVTLLPLQLGRLADKFIFGNTIQNDLLLFAASLSCCLPIYAKLLLRFPPRELAQSGRFLQIGGSLPDLSPADTNKGARLSAAFIYYVVASPSFSHWLVFNRSWGAGLWNILIIPLANYYGAAWCNAYATADFLIVQLGLELFQVVPRSPWYVFIPFVCQTLWRCAIILKNSHTLNKLNKQTRAHNYLEGLEVQNYNPDAVSAAI